MIEIEDLLNMVKSYNLEDVVRIKNAYEFAKVLHKGQVRQSGEEYITHPLNVAYILAEMHADGDTVCAGLLHDTLEDTNITKEDIIENFNKDVANLVDGVTKIRKLNFSSKQAQNLANTRKIITGITEDVRIIIIKLADRLHNMRTMDYKSEFKQKENSIETMEIFVPLAYHIGAYRIKSELEDLSLKYLKPDTYKNIEEKKLILEKKYNTILEEILYSIKMMLEDKNIPNEIKIRTKNIYGIYKRLNEGASLADIHDLLSLKVMVQNIEQCYLTFGMIHSKYKPVNEMFKDYISSPKTNRYRSLHTTLFGPEGRLVQTQIRTFDMDKVASFGLCTYWDINKNQARDVMQKDLKENYQFFKSLLEINKVFGDNQDFLFQVKSELFSDKVHVYSSSGEMLSFPKGSTAIDFAYEIHTDIGNTMVAAKINDEYVPVDYVLQNNDRVNIITDALSFGPREDWIEKVKTTRAKRKIKEFNRK